MVISSLLPTTHHIRKHNSLQPINAIHFESFYPIPEYSVTIRGIPDEVLSVGNVLEEVLARICERSWRRSISISCGGASPTVTLTLSLKDAAAHAEVVVQRASACGFDAQINTSEPEPESECVPKKSKPDTSSKPPKIDTAVTINGISEEALSVGNLLEEVLATLCPFAWRKYISVSPGGVTLILKRGNAAAHAEVIVQRATAQGYAARIHTTEPDPFFDAQEDSDSEGELLQ